MLLGHWPIIISLAPVNYQLITTKPTSPWPILIILSTRLGSDKYQFLGHWSGSTRVRTCGFESHHLPKWDAQLIWPCHVVRTLKTSPKKTHNRRLSLVPVPAAGQLVAYELVHTSDSSCPVELLNVDIPDGDHDFGNASGPSMPFLRSDYNKKTGQSPNNPRKPVSVAVILYRSICWLCRRNILITNIVVKKARTKIPDGAASQMGPFPRSMAM